MSDQPTYEELEQRCQLLANIIVRNNNATEMLLRAEVKKAKAEAWEEGFDAGWESGRDSHEMEQGFIEDYAPIINPYKEQS